MVYNCKTNIPISNVDLTLKDYNVSPTDVITDEHEVLHLKSDSNGKFNLEYYADMEYTYHILVAEKESECSVGLDNFHILPREKNFYKLHMTSVCHSSIHVKNVSPFDANDKMCYRYSSVPITSTTCSGDVTGMDVDFNDSGSSMITQGYGYLYIKWYGTKNNIENAYQDSIFLPPCGTVVYNLFY